MEKKTCSTCKTPQPLSNFHKCKKFKDGLVYDCKSCVSKKYKLRQTPEKKENKKQIRLNRTDEDKLMESLKRSAKKRKLSLEYVIKEHEIVTEAEKLNMKYCYSCSRVLEKTSFGKLHISKDGLNTICKECRIASTRVYYKENSELIIASKREYVKINKEMIYDRQKKYVKNRRKEDPVYHLTFNLRSRLKTYIKRIKKSYKLPKSPIELVGCTAEKLKEHIESKFVDDMSWDNYGYRGWHLDHIIPLCTAKTKEEVYALNHYTNLQPLWAIDNMKKGKKIITPSL
jgi:hypothetical protein